MKEKDKISKTYFKKDNELFEQLSPNYSLIKTSYRKKIPNFYSMNFNNINNIDNKNQKKEKLN